jgi:hypothetical protein
MVMMSTHDVFAEAAKVEADLDLIEKIRWARKEFLDRICDASTSRKDDVLAALRSESTYQLAEFLYLLRARDIESEEQMRTVAELHNEYMVNLSKDQAKADRLGLTQERLLDAMFTGDTMPRLLHHWKLQPGTLDQSNLARFLMPLMSTETCRKVVVACTAAGFLIRERSPHGTMLLRSVGVLERVFAQCVRDLRERIEAG